MLHRARREGPRSGLPRRLRARARGRRGLRVRDGRRPLPRPGGPRAPAERRARRRRRPRAGLALRGRRRRRRLGRPPAPGQPRRLVVRARASWACRCATSPAASSASAPTCCEAIDLPSVRSRGYAFQVELTYRALRARLARGRGPDRLPRPRAGHARRCPGGSPPRRRGSCRGCAGAPRTCDIRPRSLKPRLPRAESTQGERQRARPRPGHGRHPRRPAALARARRWRSCARGRSARRPSRSPCCWPSGSSRTSSRPTRRGYLIPGLDEPATARRGRPRPLSQLARARAARDGVRGGLHRRQLAAAAGRAATTAGGAPCTRRPGPPPSSSWPARRRSRCAPRPTCWATRPRRWPSSCDDRPRAR